MIKIKLIDQAGALSPSEFKRLESFITDQCRCRTEEIKGLKHVKIRDDGNSGYSGYWTAQYTIDGADVKEITAAIILNSFYLKTVEQMERTLAHEYGHHWTLYYSMDACMHACTHPQIRKEAQNQEICVNSKTVKNIKVAQPNQHCWSLKITTQRKKTQSHSFVTVFVTV